MHVRVVEQERQGGVEPRSVLGMREAHQGLDAAFQVADHEVGRTDEVQRFVAVVPVVESVDTRVLEISPEYRTHPNVLRHSGHAGAQTANSAHHHVDAGAGVARGVQRADHIRVLDRVELEGDATRRTKRCLVLDETDEFFLELVRRHDELLIVRLATVSRQVVEQLRGVAPDRFFAGEESDVFVDARGRGVVVAGRHVHVPADAARLFAHDEDALGVGLQTDEPVVDVHAGQLQFARPSDVARLVESRLQLQDDCDLLAGLRGVDEVTCNLAVARRAIERHLYREHFRVARRLLHERLGRRRERFIGMVHQQLSRANDFEHRPPRFFGGGEPTGGHRGPWFEAVFGKVERRKLMQGGKLHERVVANHVFGVEFEFGAHASQHRGLHVALHLETRGATKTAAAQFHLDGGEQVFGVFVLERKVGIARDPEARDLRDFHAREQPVEVSFDQVFEEDEVVRVGHRDEAGEVARNLQAGKTLVTRLGVAYHDGKIQREVGDVRERMRRIDGERRENRKDATLKVGGEQFFGALADLVPTHDANSGASQCREELAMQQSFLRDDERLHALRHRIALLARRHAVGTALGDFGCDLVLECGDPNLVELIEVRRADREELEPLQERHVRSRGERQHTLVEVEPAQFAVDEARVNTRTVTSRRRRGVGRAPNWSRRH